MNVFLIALTVVSLASAATLAVLLWRMVRRERLRSDARVDALATVLAVSDSGDSDRDPEAFAPRLFVDESAPARLPTTAVAGAAAFVVALATALVVLIGGESRAPAALQTPSSLPPGLELLRLDHERLDSRLEVRGLVHVPTGRVGEITAVVSMFGANGAFVANSESRLRSDQLGPGRAAFEVSVPGAAEVSRYRVSFRHGDQVLQHIDRRTGAQ